MSSYIQYIRKFQKGETMACVPHKAIAAIKQLGATALLTMMKMNHNLQYKRFKFDGKELTTATQEMSEDDMNLLVNTMMDIMSHENDQREEHNDMSIVLDMDGKEVSIYVNQPTGTWSYLNVFASGEFERFGDSVHSLVFEKDESLYFINDCEQIVFPKDVRNFVSTLKRRHFSRENMLMRMPMRIKHVSLSDNKLTEVTAKSNVDMAIDLAIIRAKQKNIPSEYDLRFNPDKKKITTTTVKFYRKFDEKQVKASFVVDQKGNIYHNRKKIAKDNMSSTLNKISNENPQKSHGFIVSNTTQGLTAKGLNEQEWEIFSIE